jgi:hypothetical protein
MFVKNIKFRGILSFILNVPQCNVHRRYEIICDGFEDCVRTDLQN